MGFSKFTFLSGTLTLASALSGCGIYQNQGRRSFESRSSGQLKTEIGMSQIRPCWQQSADEPIWPHENFQITVERKENNQLHICAEEVP